MEFRVSVIKDGRELVHEIVSAPSEGNITGAIIRVVAAAREIESPLYPFQVDVRDA
ncbi:MAG: hypothetical protein HOK21_07050 [Rhodospirillaceae bacterium]|jgi:hypothetical protein|nr:hypothetical protein [Rhodospirillaceae bacterium]MBT4043632.1 hypothetical protein [Rhodospirillaceae bacterium]MBT4686827.1 hypothetical protein [Rhodospirillaceae bacterium]MBT5081931.1 hypothetical protein [Rhodospirillaceae bacterium]MBT5523824.1 hypothetical protein [Rhodospirillaceae bacterium]